MNYATKTDIGKRLHNEDLARIPERPESLPFLAVADGMGGHAAGDVASRLVIDGMAEALQRPVDEDAILQLRQAISRVNRQVYAESQRDPGRHGMGSTLVCALLFENHFIAANVGDSRMYLFDGTSLEQVTTDHSYVQMLVSEGHITREEARVHPNRNLITRAMGLSLRVEADIFDRSWGTGDLLLLCSDGLCDSVTDQEIAALLSTPGATLQELCDLLVSRAKENDASDNITVALARCAGGDCA